MRPRLPAMLLAPGGLGHRFALCRYRRFFGLRTSPVVSSVASGRIEFVSQPSFGPQFYGLSVHFQLLSTPCRHDAVTFSFWREAPPQRDSHPPVHAHSQAHWSLSRCDRQVPRPARQPQPNRLIEWQCSSSTLSHQKGREPGLGLGYYGRYRFPSSMPDGMPCSQLLGAFHGRSESRSELEGVEQPDVRAARKKAALSIQTLRWRRD